MYTCDRCGAEFESSYELTDHYLNTHALAELEEEDEDENEDS